MKKKNKKTMNKRKKKIIIISTAIIAFFIILIIAIKLTQDNKKVDSINDANSLKSVVEFCECKFISSKDSEQDGYNMDIYLEFKYDPYQDGQSKQPYYDVTIDAITKYLSYRKIRLIDESREITIRVDTNNTSITKKYFNDVEESEYFSKLLSQYTLDNQQDFKETECLNSILSVIFSTVSESPPGLSHPTLLSVHPQLKALDLRQVLLQAHISDAFHLKNDTDIDHNAALRL